jgi:hypothetical protein
VRYSASTTATPAQALRLARVAFGAEGAGLRLADLALTSARYSGGGGFVSVDARRTPAGATEVIVETREFDAEARHYLRSLPHQAWWSTLWRRMRGYARPRTRP